MTGRSEALAQVKRGCAEQPELYAGFCRPVTPSCGDVRRKASDLHL